MKTSPGTGEYETILKSISGAFQPNLGACLAKEEENDSVEMRTGKAFRDWELIQSSGYPGR